MSPDELLPHYSRFRVGERILLTGHSHQAWPDVAFDGQAQAFDDAAAYVDDKWERAFVVADQVRAGYRRLLGDGSQDIVLGQSTHDLVVRFLSALSLRERPRLVTTDGEFHTLRRQLDRLAEEGIELVRIAARPVDTLAARLAASLDDRTAAVLVSSVLFETAELVPALGELALAAERLGVATLVDAYHHLNVVPFDVAAMGLEQAFIVGGGYKYCQLGEGNCFLHVPASCQLRPVVTGWYSEFGLLSAGRKGAEVAYGEGAARFAGATYDPTSHYRAAAVLEFFSQNALTPELLRRISVRQTELLASSFAALDLPPEVASLIVHEPSRRAGFVALRVAGASQVVTSLRARGVWTDARGDLLRLGPAPYVGDAQLECAIAILGETLRATQRSSGR